MVCSGFANGWRVLAHTAAASLVKSEENHLSSDGFQSHVIPWRLKEHLELCFESGSYAAVVADGPGISSISNTVRSCLVAFSPVWTLSILQWANWKVVNGWTVSVRDLAPWLLDCSVLLTWEFGQVEGKSVRPCYQAETWLVFSWLSHLILYLDLLKTLCNFFQASQMMCWYSCSRV